MTTEEEQAIVDRSNELVHTIAPQLMREQQLVITMVLGELVARFIMCHAASARAGTLYSLLKLVDSLVTKLDEKMHERDADVIIPKPTLQ